MNRISLFSKDFRPQFSGHETFPLRYGWLKKAYDAVNSPKENSHSIFHQEDAIALFGAGKNMVQSMRHWSIAAGILEERNNQAYSTDFGDLIFGESGLDPWMENISTVWLIHWNIITKSKKASYTWLFNYFNNHQFDRATLTQHLHRFCEECDWKVASNSTLKRDIECLVRAYVNRKAKDNEFSEDQIESPLAELGIIQPLNKNDVFQLKRGSQHSLSNAVFLYGLIEFWKSAFSSSRTLTLETITYEPGSPGRVFCLDEDAVAERLYQIEQYSNGKLSWSETAGLRQVLASVPVDEVNLESLLKAEYKINLTEKAA